VLGYNRVILIGTLTRDPEVRYNPKGERVARITVAIPHGRDSKITTDYFDVLVFLRDQESPVEKIQKGQWVLVEGKVKQRRWETPEGQSRTKVEIMADSVERLGKYPGGGRGER
jgi:single-strand DNA-binding protein